MPFCLICKRKGSYTTEKSNICYSCIKNIAAESIELAVYYYTKGHTLRCSNIMSVSTKLCTCGLTERQMNEKNKIKRIACPKSAK